MPEKRRPDPVPAVRPERIRPQRLETGSGIREEKVKPQSRPERVEKVAPPQSRPERVEKVAPPQQRPERVERVEPPPRVQERRDGPEGRLPSPDTDIGPRRGGGSIKSR
jgi:hypothetical protein